MSVTDSYGINREHMIPSLLGREWSTKNKIYPSVHIVIIFFIGAAVLCGQNSVLFAAEKAAGAQDRSVSSEITKEEIDGFLFNVGPAVRQKVELLSGEVKHEIDIPILFGVEPCEIEDTWGEARSQGRVHKATDIMAPRGAIIVSPTEAVVTNIGYDNLGGNYVITANPGGEQFYYAHLNRVASGLYKGEKIEKGGLIGYVGNTGNARSVQPHLHLGVYYKGKARNPYPRFEETFSTKERLDALAGIAMDSEISNSIISEYDSFIELASSKGINIPTSIIKAQQNQVSSPGGASLASDMDVGSQGKGVENLQQFLIEKDVGSEARELAEAGATGYFGSLTKNALIEYQESENINPAKGYFGPITRAQVFSDLSKGISGRGILSSGAVNALPGKNSTPMMTNVSNQVGTTQNNDLKDLKPQDSTYFSFASVLFSVEPILLKSEK